MIILLNDTSFCHKGCIHLMNILKSYYSPDKIFKQMDNFTPIKDLPAKSTIIINGEGTMHHNARPAIKMLKYGHEAIKAGHRVELINSVWQAMDKKYLDIIKEFHNVEFREVLSHREAEEVGIITPDVSIHYDVPYKKISSTDVCIGGFFPSKTAPLKLNWPHKCDRINVFETDWDDLVNQIRGAKVVVTGRHHEMYAALAARTPVITIPGNTWKNAGFFHTVGESVLAMEVNPQNVRDTLDGKYTNNWKNVWNYLDKYEYKYKSE